MMSESVTVRVRLFAAPREALRTGEIEVKLGTGATVDDLLTRLSGTFPVLHRYVDHLSVAVNRVYVDRQTLLNDGDEVACLPPVGGG